MTGPDIAPGSRVVLYADPITCTRFECVATVERLLPLQWRVYDVHGRPLVACAVRIAGQRRLQGRAVSAALSSEGL